ncbi:MAG: N-acetylmuramoyl-L-alanine amidase CwlD [Firmicutes bacterium]|nr:N-acetylmuramoyl-L-alanine amidase CwlD [Bacillota bacterium]
MALLLAGFGIWESIQARAEEEAVEAWSWTVAGRVIVVDPGHGGVDPGAVSGSGTREKDLTLQVGQRLAHLLTEAGSNVIMTREKDEDLADPGVKGLMERKRQDLARRVACANMNQADFFISIHVNSFPASRWWGAQTFYLRSSEEGKKLAEFIQEELVKVSVENHRKAKGEDYYILEKAQVTAVNVEIGFMSNPVEEKMMKDPAYQDKLARAIYSGVVRYCAQQ